MKKTFITIAIAMMVSMVSFAQKTTIWTVDYSASVPFGSTSDFTGKFSGRGMDIGFKHFVSDNIALGAMAAWNVFVDEKGYDTFNYKGIDISGERVNYTNAVPIYATASYFFTKEDSKILPYAQLGIGTMFQEQKFDVGSQSFYDTQWQFAFAPEIGVIYPIKNGYGINVSTRYNYAVEANGMSAASYMSFNVGFVF